MIRLATGLVCLACVACATARPRPTQLPFHAVEVTEDGRELEIPSTGVTDVDVNSVIELRLNEPILRPAMQRSGGVDPVALDRVRKRAAQLRAAIEAQEAALARTLQDLEAPPGPSETKQAMAAIAELEARALRTLQALLSEEQVEALLGLGVQQGYAKTIEALEAEVAVHDAALARMEAQIDDVQFRVLASLQTSNGPIPQHLDGYDSMAEGTPQLVKKIAWRLPPDLQKEIASARALAKQLENLKGLETRVRTAVEKRAKELVEALRTAGTSFRALQSILEKWKTAPWQTLDPAKALVLSAKTLQQELTPLVDLCKPALDEVPALASDPVRASLALSDSKSQLRKCIAAIEPAAPVLVKASSGFATAARQLTAAAQADPTLAAKLTQESLAEIEAALKDAGTQSTEALVAAWKSVEVTLQRATGVIHAPPLVAGTQTTDRAYGDLQNTQIDLTRTARSNGDTLHWRASVIQDGLEARSWSSPTLRVVSTGARLDVSAAVIFVKAFEEQPQDDSFPAAAAVTAAFHYRLERASGRNSGGGFWNFLDPGLGMHIAYLDLGASTVNADGEEESDDPSNEIGVGGLVQLFGDVLTAGIGYDLQAARSYWFFGFGLKTMTDLGITVPTSPSN